VLTTRHPVDFAYTRQGLEALLRYAQAHDVEKGGYDTQSADINLWSHHWLNDATREEPETTDRHSAPTARLYEIECDEGFSPEHLMQEFWGK
jgi:hypothetical protein